MNTTGVMFSSLANTPKRSLRGVLSITSLIWILALTAILIFTQKVESIEDPGLSSQKLISVPMVPIAPPRFGSGSAIPKPKQAASNQNQAVNQFVSQKDIPREISSNPSRPPVIPASSGIEFGTNIPGLPPGSPTGSPNGVPNGVPHGVDFGQPAPPPVIQPKPAPAPVAEERRPVPDTIRKSGGVFAGSAIQRVEPTYPPLAKAARVSGAVVVEVTVDEEGNVLSARALSGHPLLKDAAVLAAKRWHFSPTRLSGVPVKVVGTITFNFNL